MAAKEVTSIALIWAQFAAYHMDRCEAVANRLGGRVQVRAIEVATTSAGYAWEPSGSLQNAVKLTLFPGQSFDTLSKFARFRAMFREARKCDMTMIGLSYAEPDVIALSWLLRLMGKKVVVFSESKFDDLPRSIFVECIKALGLACYNAAVVGGKRHLQYFRFLGFRRRPILPGYDGVGIERVREQAGRRLAPDGPAFAERSFVYVGRFVDKKNLFGLLDGFAHYVRLAGNGARRLVLVGSGELEAPLRERMDQLGVAALVNLPGFLSAEAVSRMLAESLALVLVSTEEQWGLVVNEALALGLPAIVSDQVGSRDALVRNLVNGFVVDPTSAESIGRAMFELAADEGLWRRMVAASHARSWMGDTERLADAVELLIAPDSEPAGTRCRQLLSEMEYPI